MWEALEVKEKAVYKKRNEEDRRRYQIEMEAYKARGSVALLQAPQSTEDVEDEEANEVFSSTQATTQISSHVSKGSQQQEEKTENSCIKKGCTNAAIKSAEWDDEYCSVYYFSSKVFKMRSRNISLLFYRMSVQ